MARTGFSTSNYLSVASTPVTAAPLTLTCWAKVSSVGTGAFISLAASGSLHKFELRYNASSQIAAGAQDSGSSSSQTGTSFALDTWFHAAAVFTSTTARTAFLDGVAGVTNTTSRTPASVARIGVGIRADSSFPSTPCTGTIAFPCVWPTALHANEIAAMAAGGWPGRVESVSLAGGACWPLWGIHSPEIDLTPGARSLAITGSLSAVAGPPLVGERLIPFPGAGLFVQPPDGVQAMHHFRMRRAG